MKEIVIAGSKIDSILFSLIGAKTIQLKDKSDMSKVVDYVSSNVNKVAGVMVGHKFFDEESREYAKIEKLGIPMIMLPDPTGETVDTSLDTLQEKTIGMKIKSN